MSCTIHVDKLSNHTYEKLKIKIGEDDQTVGVERVLQSLRTGYLFEGGFLVNSKEEVVFNLEPNSNYYFVGFKRPRSASVTEIPSETALAPTNHLVANPSNKSLPVKEPATTTSASIISTNGTVSDNKEKKSKSKKNKGNEDSNLESPDGEGNKSSKRKVILKDPLAPKKSLSGYLIFSNEKKPLVKQMEPDIKPREMMERLGALWRELSEEQKGEYLKVAEFDKVQYERELEAYLAMHPESVLHQKEQVTKKPKNGDVEVTASASHSFASLATGHAIPPAQKKAKQPVMTFYDNEDADDDDDDDDDERAPSTGAKAFIPTYKSSGIKAATPVTAPVLSAEVSGYMYFPFM